MMSLAGVVVTQDHCLAQFFSWEELTLFEKTWLRLKMLGESAAQLGKAFVAFCGLSELHTFRSHYVSQRLFPGDDMLCFVEFQPTAMSVKDFCISMLSICTSECAFCG